MAVHRLMQRPSSVFRYLCFLFFLSLMAVFSGCNSDYSGGVRGNGNANNGVNTLNTRGRDIYASQCVECHAADGNGVPEQVGTFSLRNCSLCYNKDVLASEIETTMPAGNNREGDCVGQCATDVAEYIMYAFNRPVTDEDVARNNPAGAEVYNQQCASCHADNGLGFGQYPTMVNCTQCTSRSVLTSYIEGSMPIGGQNPEACVGDCAANVAEHIMFTFNNRSRSTELKGISLLPAEDTLRKAAIILTGQLPEEEFVNSIASAGSTEEKETALQHAVDHLLDSEDFLVFLGDAMNDMLLNRKYLARNGDNTSAIDLISARSTLNGEPVEDYPNRNWYNDATDNRSSRNFARISTNDAIAEEVIELVKHITRNDRPFTEILTANYTMLNYYSARAYGLDPSEYDFKRLENPQVSEFPYDPEHFLPVQITSNPHASGEALPHAGVLTTPAFLNRYDTTDTNRNRHRARIIYDYFLDTDILAIGEGQPADTSDIAGDVPTINNPACNICHNILDPVAVTLHNWTEGGKYRPTSNGQGGGFFRRYNSWSFEDILPASLNGVEMDLGNNRDNSIQWLSGRIIRDPRFFRAMTRWAYRSLTNEEPLKVSDDQDQTQVDAYTTQSQVLSDIANEFKSNGVNIKHLFRSIIMSPYWRATALSEEGYEELHAKVGSQRLLTPEMMYRKMNAVLGIDWNDFNVNDPQSLANLVRLYGGIDSDSVTSRLKTPNGLISLIQDRYATELACAATARDFSRGSSDRLLFTTVESDTTPSDANEARIRQTLQHLHHQLLGERLSTDHPEITQSYALLSDVWQMGTGATSNNNRSLPSACRVQGVRQDSNYMMTSWMAVLTYLISDYGFSHE